MGQERTIFILIESRLEMHAKSTIFPKHVQKKPNAVDALSLLHSIEKVVSADNPQLIFLDILI